MFLRVFIIILLSFSPGLIYVWLNTNLPAWSFVIIVVTILTLNFFYGGMMDLAIKYIVRYHSSLRLKRIFYKGLLPTAVLFLLSLKIFLSFGYDPAYIVLAWLYLFSLIFFIAGYISNAVWLKLKDWEIF